MSMNNTSEGFGGRRNTGNAGIEHCPASALKDWVSPAIEELDVSETFGRGGPIMDSDGSPSMKS